MLDGEQKLIELAIGGKSSAFGSLYDYYQPKIYRFVLIKVGRREEAEDLTHQVFMNAWENIPGYKNLGFPFSSWLYRIARNQVIDRYRTEKQELSLSEIDPDYLFELESIEKNTDERFELERVAKAIQKLRPDYQNIIIMRFVEELSLKEVAASIEKSEGAVKLMQHRAIKELQELLNPVRNQKN